MYTGFWLFLQNETIRYPKTLSVMNNMTKFDPTLPLERELAKQIYRAQVTVRLMLSL